MTTREIAAFVSGLQYEHLSEDIVQRAKGCVQDFLGVALFVSHHTPWGRTVAQFAREEGYGSQVATIIGYGRCTVPGRAALANGTFGLGFEFEDAHLSAHLHPYSAIIPAALAIAEREHGAGQDFLAAIVAGHEVSIRAGIASHSRQGHTPPGLGMYNTQFFGVFGAAAAAGRVLGLEPEPMTMALGLAGEQAAGTWQSHQEGAWSRRIHGGKAAENGITAALLASRGFVGPTGAFEGEFSVYRALGLDFNPEALMAGLGERYELPGVWYKAYSCAAPVHASVEAMLQLRQEETLMPEAVEQVTVHLALHLNPLIARTDFPSLIAAQYSVPYCVALALFQGQVVPQEFTEERLGDDHPVVRFARERVTLAPTPEFAEERERWGTAPARVTVRLKDGREVSRQVLFPQGHPKNPMTPEEARSKFEGLAATVLPQERVRQVYQAVWALEDIRDVSALADLLVA